jgi:hypothetical protein
MATDVLGLQRTIGNQAVSRMLSRAAPRPGLRGGRLSRVMLQRDLELGGKPRATAEDVRADLGGDFGQMRDTVEALITLPVVVKLPTAAALREVHAFWTDRAAKYPKRPDSKEATLAILQLLSQGVWTYTRTEGRHMKPIWDAFDTVNVRTNLGALGDFLRANPNVVANLKAAGVGWELMSTNSQLEKMGGAAVIGERIHMGSWIVGMGDPKGFKKLAIHESGHATFQRMLITGEGWTDAANRGNEAPDERALDADGRRFYDAWSVLRKQPEFFFIVDVPGSGPEAKGDGRAGYLAGQFTEFCADSFMHMALKKDDLADHVDSLPDTEVAVKRAWQDALSILRKYEPQILGRQAGAGVATIVGHKSNLRFKAVVSELKKALGDTRLLQAADSAQARKHLDSLREAWNGLTAAGRARHRTEALTTLDDYMVKVLRRRPAQVHLGSELGFAGL